MHMCNNITEEQKFAESAFVKKISVLYGVDISGFLGALGTNS